MDERVAAGGGVAGLVMRVAALLLAVAAVFGQTLEQADGLIRSGAINEAERVLREYVKTKPNSAQAHAMLGFVLFRKNEPKQSLVEYTEAAKRRKPNAYQLKIVALDYVLLDDFVDADKWLTLAVQWAPGDADAWYHLGRTKYNENRFEEAVHAFERCLALEPRNAKAEDNLGLSLEGLGQNEPALAAYRKAIDMDAREPGPYINLGSLLVELGRVSEGVPLLNEAIRLAPGEIKPRRELGKAYLKLGRLDEAQNELEQAVKLAPEHAPAHFLLGQVYRKKGLKERAEVEFERYRKLQAEARDRMGRR